MWGALCWGNPKENCTQPMLWVASFLPQLCRRKSRLLFCFAEIIHLRLFSDTLPSTRTNNTNSSLKHSRKLAMQKDLFSLIRIFPHLVMLDLVKEFSLSISASPPRTHFVSCTIIYLCWLSIKPNSYQVSERQFCTNVLLPKSPPQLQYLPTIKWTFNWDDFKFAQVCTVVAMELNVLKLHHYPCSLT